MNRLCYFYPVNEEQSTSRYAAVFLEYKSELDARHDKHERLVKLSRDTTIHSKRAIFLLHRAAGERESDARGDLLLDGEDKLREVLQFLRATGKEIHGSDPWLHSSAYSPGLQEFIEALSYYGFLRQGQLLSMEEARHWLSFTRLELEGESLESVEDGNEGTVEGAENERIHVPLSEMNYVLGIADLAGELMRMCITAVGAGQQEVPFQVLPFMRCIYCGFHSLPPVSKEIIHKLRLLKSSMAKIENACYTLQIRGSEIPRQMMSDVFNEPIEGDRTSDFFDTES